MVHRLGRRRPLAAFHARRQPPRRGRRLCRRRHARSLSRSEDSLSQPLAPFLGRRRRPLGRACDDDSMRDAIERARIAVDLAFVSVLLDAGAGDAWRYRERETGLVLRALGGTCRRQPRHVSRRAFSSDAGQPWRVDNVALTAIDAATLARSFPGRCRQSAGRIGAAQRAAAASRRGARRPHGSVRTARRHVPATWSITLGYRRRPPHPGVDAARHPARRPILDLAVRADAQRISVGDAGRHPAVRTDDAQRHASCRSTSSRNG